MSKDKASGASGARHESEYFKISRKVLGIFKGFKACVQMHCGESASSLVLVPTGTPSRKET